MSKKRKYTSIYDLLTPEAKQAIDEHGYAFLAEHGYNTDGAIKSNKKRAALLEAMEARNEAIAVGEKYDYERRRALFWIELHREGRFVSRSKGITFILGMEDVDGENGTDKEGPTENT